MLRSLDQVFSNFIRADGTTTKCALHANSSWIKTDFINRLQLRKEHRSDFNRNFVLRTFTERLTTRPMRRTK